MTRHVFPCPSWAWLIPPALLSLTVFSLCVDVLHWDEWIIWGGMLDKMHQGTFGIADLIAQHNEHRNLAVRLFGFLLLPVFKLNRFADYGLNILLAGGVFWTAVKVHARASEENAPPCVRLVFSLLAFSLLQWETFTIGFNNALLAVVLCLWLGVLAASSGAMTLPRLLALALIGVIPSFTFANGLFYWICLVPLISSRCAGKRRRVRMLALWAGLAALVWSGYFWDFESPGQHPSLAGGFRHPLRLAGYFFGYLGGGVTSDRNLVLLSAGVGACALAVFCLSAWREWRAGGERRERLLPWLCVALFTFCSAGATALARCGYGVEQAVESRYATFTTPFWMALFAILFTAWKRAQGRDRFLVATKRFAAVCLAVFCLSTVLSFVVVFNRHDRFVKARSALFTLTDERALQEIFPDVAYLMTTLPLFLEKRLSIYRGIEKFDAYAQTREAAGVFSVEGKSLAAEGRIPGFRVKGTVDKRACHEGAMVLLVTVGKVVGALPVCPNGGAWQLFLPSGNLPGGTARLKAYVVPAGGGPLAPLAPAGGVAVDPGPLVTPDFRVNQFFFEH